MGVFSLLPLHSTLEILHKKSPSCNNFGQGRTLIMLHFQYLPSVLMSIFSSATEHQDKLCNGILLFANY